MAAGLFKQTCLAVLDEVAQKSTEVVITKRGVPVARLVPVETPEKREQEILSELRGTGKMLVREDEFLRPTTDDAGWAIDDG